MDNNVPKVATTKDDAADAGGDTSAYLNQLTPKERQAYMIAKTHLGMSFDLAKSNGFLQWRAKLPSANDPPSSGNLRSL